MFEAFEPLMGGAWSRAAAALAADEEALLRRALQPGETVEHYVRGRGQGVGWTIWALTPQRLVFATVKGRRAPRVHAHGAVRRVEAVSGKWGATLVVEAAGTREAIFGADATLGDRFFEALAAYRPDIALPEKLVVVPAAAAPAAPAAVNGTAPGTRAAAAAVSADDATRLVEALHEAGEMKEKGLLTDEEFARLKRRLLGS
jgi:hypothetical protein